VRSWDVTDPAHPVPGAVFTGPGGDVAAVAVSPDGRRLAAGSADTGAYLWDLADPARREVLIGATAKIHAVAFSPDGRTLAAGGADRAVHLWNVADPTLLQRIGDRLLHWRMLGVLQRIGLAYLVAALVARKASSRRVAATAAALLVGYWAAMTLLPVPGEGTIGAHLLDDRSRTLAAWVDRATLDWSRWGLGNHIWDTGVTYDPEGLLSTIPAVATVLLGILAGRWIAAPRPLADRLRGLVAAGVVLVALGVAWGVSFPINKGIWTSSYTLLTAGMACAGVAAVAWLVEVRRWDGWGRPFAVYGTNPMVAFVGSAVAAKIIHSTLKVKVDGHHVGGEQALHHALVGAGMDPQAASLAYALAFVAAWFGVLLVLYRRGIVFRV